MLTITSVEKLPTRKPRTKKSKLLTPVHLILGQFVKVPDAPVRAVDACGAYQKHQQQSFPALVDGVLYLTATEFEANQ